MSSVGDAFFFVLNKSSRSRRDFYVVVDVRSWVQLLHLLLLLLLLWWRLLLLLFTTIMLVLLDVIFCFLPTVSK